MAVRNVSWLGLGFIAFGLFVLLIAIPYAVTSPSNVRAIVLSPTFWPTIVGWLIIILGVLLVATRMAQPAVAGEAGGGETDAREDAGDAGDVAAWLRLAAAAVIMVGLVIATPVVGMVWATVIAFALLSVVVRAPQPILSAIIAIVLPLLLYAFFNHVAGVAVPQGEFIRLP